MDGSSKISIQSYSFFKNVYTIYSLQDTIVLFLALVN